MIYLLIVFIMSGDRGRAMVFSYQSIPPRACVYYLVPMTNRFLQQVCEFFMTNVESMDYTHSHPSTIASLSSTVQLSPVHYTHLILSSNQPPYLPIMAFT